MADQQNQGTTILRRALTDQAFRQRLTGDPKAALKEQGITVPEGVTVHVHEADEKTAHLVLPPVPKEPLSAADLDRLSGGGGCNSPYTQFIG